MPPVRPGLAARRTHDYKRNGTTTLFAALGIATGKVVDTCQPRHRHQEFLKFLKLVAKTYLRVALHIVCDNYSAHKHPAVVKCLERNPRIQSHFARASGSWPSLVEVFSSIISRQAIRCCSFASVRERTFIAAWKERCEPFVWTKPADEVLAHCKPKDTSATAH